MNERVRIAWLAGVNLGLAALELGWLVLANRYLTSSIAASWNHEFPIFLCIGLLYGHVLVIGSIAAMGPWRWQIRIPVLAAIWFLVVAVDCLAFFRILPHEPPLPVFLLLAGSSLIILVTLQLPLGPRLRRWRLVNLKAADGHHLPWKFSLRELFLWTGIVGLMCGLGQFVVAAAYDSQDPESLPLRVFAFYLCLAAPTAIILLAAELPIGPRLGFLAPRSPQQATEPSLNLASQERQSTFTLRDLFICTTIIALVLAAGRVLMAIAPKVSGDVMTVRVLVIFTEFAAATLLIAWPLFWALWSPGWWWKLLISFAIAVLGTALESYVLLVSLGDGPGLSSSWELFLLIGCLNLTTYLVLASHVAAMRALGYRLA